ncbi:MAG TPA: TIGR00725 family protein [Nitrospirae bacterium]|nr:TIGR00725 family protein [Nitrospirota bacterium]
MKRVIAVIGGRRVKKGLLLMAEDVGRLIAERGAVLLCGGLGGIMEASAKGAKDAGGLTLGVLPQDDKGHANPFIDIPVATGLGIGRNVIIARTADAFVAIGGQYGTLSEIAFSLQLKKPVIGIETWDIDGVIRAETPEDAVRKIFDNLKYKSVL